MTVHSHPVGQLLAWLASGGRLMADDLAELRFADDVDRRAVERRIRAAAKEISHARQEGHRGHARTIARESAAEIVAMTGPALPPREDTPDEPTDPRGLAALIKRSGW